MSGQIPLPAQSANPAIQSDPSQDSTKPKSQYLAPGASVINERGFSEAVAARIEAPQRVSTKSVYGAKRTIFTKWCHRNQVDFRAKVADFLLNLFQDRKLQPSTVDGYSQPLQTNWEIHPSIVAKMRISLVSWLVSTETDLRVGEASPPGTSLSYSI